MVIFEFFLSAPAANVERDDGASGAQLIGENAVIDGSGNDHASDGECGNALGQDASIAGFQTICIQTALQHAYHSFEYSLKGASGCCATARRVGRLSLGTSVPHRRRNRRWPESRLV